MTSTSTDPLEPHRPSDFGPAGDAPAADAPAAPAPALSVPALSTTPPPDGIIRVSKLNLSLLALALTSISAGLYLSPVSAPLRHDVSQLAAKGPVVALPRTSSTTWPGSTATRWPHTGTTTEATTSRRTTSSAHSTSHAPTSGASVFARSAAYLPTVTRVATTTVTSTPGPTATPSSAAKTHCWQFTWQQDAQAVYVQNLSDPYGLDGDPGPYDGDGIACSDLPVDPTRSPSMPVGQYVAPKASADTKAAIVAAPKKFFGFTQDGLPGDTSMFNTVEKAAGKAPSSVGWYETFDDAYRGDLVQSSWSRGALPVFTWMPTDNGTSGNHYSLSTIIDGSNDAYLRRFAGDVVRANLPVVIRFGHEMNGSWYPWSAGRTDYNNTPAKYKQAWIHVWQVFDSVGANDDVVWLWAPSRIDNLKVNGTNGNTAMADDYPGDQYVDWVGASVYLRHASTGSSYDASFGQTIAALEAVTSKPIFIPEVGAIETDGTTDEAPLKADFIHNTLGAFAADPRIVGFLWNNNVATQIVDGVPVSNDWRFMSNPTAAGQFVTEVADPRFRTGLVGIDG